MTDRQLLQQALDALENSVDRVLEDAYQAEKFYGNYPTRQGKVNGLKVLADDHEKAITALTERLAHCDRCGKKLGGEGDIHTCTPLELRRFEKWWDAEDDIPNDGPYTPDTPIQFAWAGWQAALAQPGQQGDFCDLNCVWTNHHPDCKLAQPEQEPVAIALNTGTRQGVKWLKNVEHGENLYTTPPAAAQPAAPAAAPVPETCGRLESDPDEGHIFVPRIEGDWSMLGKDLFTTQPAAPVQEPFSPEAIRATQRAWQMGYEAAKAEMQTKQKPVAWLHPANATYVTTDPTAYARGIPLYTNQPAAPMTEFEEAVAAVDNTLHYAIDHWQDRALKAEAKLAQPEQEPYGWVQPNPSFNSGIFNQGAECPSGWVGSAIAVYTAQPTAQPEQEPVEELLKQSRANFDHNFGKAGQGWADWIYADLLELLTTPPAAQPAPVQPEQEPVGDEWTPCMKLPVVVHVRKQRPGEAHVSTREGITPVKPDDLIMRGVSGEEYPIGRAIFEQTYSLDATPPAAQRTWVGLTKADINEIWKGEPMLLPWDMTRTLAIEQRLKDKNT